ncbi:MAG: hypothetical protein GY759_22345 [Chloroflexi bacterium]|nr:hypothetical protein [Chloroflexota bacterium]
MTVSLRAWRLEWGQPVPIPGVLTLGPAARPNGVLNTAKRNAYNNSYNFILPQSWLTGADIKLEAEVNANSAVAETNYANNKLTTGNIRTRTSSPANVGIVLVKAAGLTPSIKSNSLHTNMIAYLRAVFPAAKVNFWYKSGGAIEANYDYRVPGDGTCGDGWADLLDDLEDIYDDWKNRPGNAFIYGLLDPGVTGAGGCGRLGEPIAAGKLSGNAGPTLAHEMGHNLGRSHAPCGVPDPDKNYPTYLNPQGAPYPASSIGQVGLNVSTQQTFNPAIAKDLMSYCGPEWFSPYNYLGVLNRLPSTLTASSITQETPHVTINGRIRDGRIELPRPFWVQDKPQGQYDGPGEGSYGVSLRNAANDILFERRFEPPTDKLAEDHDVGYFREVLPYHPETTAIVFMQDEQLMRMVLVSPHPPSVHLLSPNGGENWQGSGPFTIRWQAEDTDGDELSARILYSADGGGSWDSLAVNVKGEEFLVNAGDLPGSPEALVKVVVSDGVNTSEAVSDAPFSVDDKPPLAWITQPPNGTILYPEQPVFLQGLASDPETGPVPDERLQWRSDLDGYLGEGADLAIPALSAGAHRLTLTAEGAIGQEVETSITVIVGLSPYFPLILQ